MKNNLDIEKFQEIAKAFIIDIIYSAEESHEKAFEGDRERNDLVAGIFLNDAISASNSLKVLYYQNPSFEHSEFKEFFTGFDAYKRELLNNISTNHNHQWTDINYRTFIKQAIPLTELLNMELSDTLREMLSE